MSKTFLMCSAAALLCSSAAFAADIPSTVPPAAVAPVPPVLDWTGFYVGASVGARFLQNDWTTTDYSAPVPGGLPIDFESDPGATLDDEALRLGGFLGYNFQISPSVVLGVEADFGWADNDVQRTGIPGTDQGGDSFIGFESTWDGSIRGRAGYALLPNVIVYGTGGLAVMEVQAEAVCPGDTNVCDPSEGTQSNDESDTLVGWTVGAGIESALGDGWLVRAEYRYSDFGELEFDGFTPTDDIYGFAGEAEVSSHTAAVGIGYKF